MEKVPKSVLALSALAASTMACSGSEFIFSNDPVISGIRGAIGAAALGVEAFGIDPLINAPTNRNIPLGCFQFAFITGVPIVAGLRNIRWWDMVY